jgi:hypothetical protein
VSAETKDGKVLVERSCAKNAESLHHREARAVHDREVLIAEVRSDPACDLEVRGDDRLDRGRAASERVPESLRRGATETVSDQKPRLDEDVVACDEPLSGAGDVSEAELIRTAIDEFTRTDGRPRPSLPLFESIGETTLAYRVDDALAEGFGRD